MAPSGTKIGGIYVEVDGDIMPLEESLRKIAVVAKKSADEIGSAMGGALSSKQVEAGLNSLAKSLQTLRGYASSAGKDISGLGIELGELQKMLGVTAGQFQFLQSKMLETSAAKAQEKALAALMTQTGLTRDQLIAMGGAFANLPTSIQLAIRAFYDESRALNLTSDAFGKLYSEMAAFKSVADVEATIRRVGAAAGKTGDDLVHWARTLDVDVAALKNFKTASEAAAEANYAAFTKMLGPLQLAGAEIAKLYAGSQKAGNVRDLEAAILATGKAMGWSNDQTVAWARSLTSLNPAALKNLKTDAEQAAAATHAAAVKAEQDFRAMALSAGAPESAIKTLHARMLDTSAQTRAAQAYQTLQKATGMTTKELEAMGIQAVAMPAHMQRASTAASGLGISFYDLTRYAAMFGVTLSAITLANFVTETQAAHRELIAITRAFESLKGSPAAAAIELDALRKVAGELGKNFYDVAPAYKGLLSAGQQAGLGADQMRIMFQSVLEASTALGLSSERTGGILLAWQQMISKGCHAKGTLIRMADGSAKKVEDIQVGECLMGPEGNPRWVLVLARGEEPMFTVTPEQGDPFTVNIHHILQLHNSDSGQEESVVLEDYLAMPDEDKCKYFLINLEYGHVGIRGVAPIEEVCGHFYGFALSGDKRYIDNQLFIHHNTVSMEELRRQMGEHLPGAFNLAAQAMGMTTDEFNKQVESGKVLALDLLPKLSAVLHSTYGAAAKQAAQDSIATWERFKQATKDAMVAIGDAAAPAWDRMIKATTDWLNSHRALLASASAAVVAFVSHLDAVVVAIGVMGAAWVAMNWAAVAAGISSAAGAVKALTLAMMANPVMALAGALGLLIGIAATAKTPLEQAAEKTADFAKAAMEADKALAAASTRLAQGEKALKDYNRAMWDSNGDAEKQQLALEKLSQTFPDLVANVKLGKEAQEGLAVAIAQVNAAQKELQDRAKTDYWAKMAAEMEDAIQKGTSLATMIDGLRRGIEENRGSGGLLFNFIASGQEKDLTKTFEGVAEWTGKLVPLFNELASAKLKFASDPEKIEQINATMQTLFERAKKYAEAIPTDSPTYKGIMQTLAAIQSVMNALPGATSGVQSAMGYAQSEIEKLAQEAIKTEHKKLAEKIKAANVEREVLRMAAEEGVITETQKNQRIKLLDDALTEWKKQNLEKQAKESEEAARKAETAANAEIAANKQAFDEEMALVSSGLSQKKSAYEQGKITIDQLIAAYKQEADAYSDVAKRYVDDDGKIAKKREESLAHAKKAADLKHTMESDIAIQVAEMQGRGLDHDVLVLQARMDKEAEALEKTLLARYGYGEQTDKIMEMFYQREIRRIEEAKAKRIAAELEVKIEAARLAGDLTTVKALELKKFEAQLVSSNLSQEGKDQAHRNKVEEIYGSSWKKMLLQWQDTTKLFDEATKNMLQGIQQGFADTINKGLKGEFKTLGDAWKSLMDAFINVFAQMVAHILSIWAVSNIAGLFTKTPGLSLGDLFGGKGGAVGTASSALSLAGGAKSFWGLFGGGAAAAPVMAPNAISWLTGSGGFGAAASPAAGSALYAGGEWAGTGFAAGQGGLMAGIKSQFTAAIEAVKGWFPSLASEAAPAAAEAGAVLGSEMSLGLTSGLAWAGGALAAGELMAMLMGDGAVGPVGAIMELISGGGQGHTKQSAIKYEQLSVDAIGRQSAGLGSILGSEQDVAMGGFGSKRSLTEIKAQMDDMRLLGERAGLTAHQVDLLTQGMAGLDRQMQDAARVGNKELAASLMADMDELLKIEAQTGISTASLNAMSGAYAQIAQASDLAGPKIADFVRVAQEGLYNTGGAAQTLGERMTALADGLGLPRAAAEGLKQQFSELLGQWQANEISSETLAAMLQNQFVLALQNAARAGFDVKTSLEEIPKYIEIEIHTSRTGDDSSGGEEDLPSYGVGGFIRQTGPALVHAGEYMLTRGDVADIQGGAKRLGIPQDSGQALVLNYSPTINVNGGNKAEVMAILAQERVKIARMLQPRPQQLRSGV